jgi:hypothetical protein
VDELSKNGYGVILNDTLMNSLGTTSTLAEEVLKETDWIVSEDTEVIVEKNSESLVYVNFPNVSLSVLKGWNIYKVIDSHLQNSANQGIISQKASDLELNYILNRPVLAFYSCCTSSPLRF